jgi:hypothetical protein
MINWNRIAGMSFIGLSFVSAFFFQEDLMISLGLAGIYCAIYDISIIINKHEVQQ